MKTASVTLSESDARILEAILTERARQRVLWDHEGPWGRGDCSSDEVPDIVKAAVLSEECGEVAAAVLDKLQPRDLQRELIQTAAVCVAWLEAL